ncbi:MAG TPA: hypothetical protein VMU45_07375 [Candidatus Eisenbacteria bacterium]|nr:hypothetical protein [Candidatus Eisenbacteria bacterium]
MSLWNRFCNAAIAVGIVVVAVSFVSPGVSAGQAQETAAAPEASPEIHAVLEKIVHPKKVKVGDQVVARLTESTKLKDGTELPKGSHVLGKVTELKVKADKEGPSKLGILFDKAELKDGKEMPLSMALVSLAPRYEPGSVDPVAAENTASGAGRISQMSQAQGRTEGSAGSDTLSKGLGIRGASSVSLEAMRPGVCYVPDITIASYSMGEPGTIFQSTKTTVYLDSGSRLLLLAQ